MDLNSHFSDESDQDAPTIFAHMKNFIHWMNDNTFFIKDGMIYDNTDGCRK